MTSKYAKNFEEYASKTEYHNFNSSNLRFISVSKNAPKTYVQPLANELLPVPIHKFVKTNSGKSVDFICRKFVNDDCYICDNVIDDWGKKATPKKVMLALAIEFENAGPKKYVPVYEDVKVNKEKADEIKSKFKGVETVDSDTESIFTHLPKVGIFMANKSIDNDLAVSIAEFGGIDDGIFRVSREGEKLQTRYSCMRVSDSPADLNDEEFKIAIALHMTIDEYIDTYISEDRYQRLLLSKNDSSKNDSKSEDEEQSSSSYESDNDEEESSSSEDIDEIIRRKYQGASN